MKGRLWTIFYAFAVFTIVFSNMSSIYAQNLERIERVEHVEQIFVSTQIGGETYLTLKEALENVQDGETIKLLFRLFINGQ